MTYFLIAVVVLFAILVAVLIPTLLQARTTLVSAQKFLDATQPQVERTLDELTTTAQHLQRVATGIEERVDQAKDILGSAQHVVGQVARLGKSIQTVTAIGAAVGPAVVAAARAFFTRGSSAEIDKDVREEKVEPVLGEPVVAEEVGDHRGRESRS